MLSGVAAVTVGLIPAGLAGQSRGGALHSIRDIVGTLSQEPELSTQEEAEVAFLKKTDREVRQHEQAHMAAGADLITSGPSYDYETGPDGMRYAVSGEVGIDTSKADTPEETLAKARRIRATALAPAEPSSQDLRVAALASQMEMTALQEMARARQEESAEAQAGRTDKSGQESQGVSAYQDMLGMAGELGFSRSGLSAYA